MEKLETLHTCGEFVMTYKDPMYIVNDTSDNNRIILQMHKDHHSITYACKCVDNLYKRREARRSINQL